MLLANAKLHYVGKTPECSGRHAARLPVSSKSGAIRAANCRGDAIPVFSFVTAVLQQLLSLLPAAASSIQPCSNLVWLSFQVVTQHPPVLSYSIENRLQPFMAFLKEIGIADPAQTVLQRPTLLGLDADNSLRAIVGYLQENGHSSEEVAHLLQTTI